MRGIICSDLFSLSDVRTEKSNTTAIRDLVKGAIDQGLNISCVIRFFPIITRRGLFVPRKRNDGGLVIYDVPKIGVRYFYSSLLTRMVLKLLGFSGNYDFAVCHAVPNFDAAINVIFKEVGKKILIVHQSDFKNKDLNFYLKEADSVFTRSYALGNKLIREYQYKQDAVVFSGVPEKMLADNSSDANFTSCKYFRFVIACSFIPLKNILESIDAFHMLSKIQPNITLDIYGDGPLFADIKNRLLELGLGDTVKLHGFIDRSAVFKGFRRCHVFLMPSAPETLGLAYLEAMAAGCVVIGHKGWGVDGIVEDEVNGYLVNQATPDEIFNKMKHYVNLKEEDRIDIHKKSRESVSNFTSYKAAKNYKDAILSAVGNHRSAEKLGSAY